MDSTQLNPDEWSQLGAWFDRYCEVPAHDLDLSELDQERSKHPKLIKLLEQMLNAASSDDASMLDQTIISAGILPNAFSADLPSCAGQRFGPWLALDEIGRGGMAVVMRGKRADGQFDKEVAIKLLANPSPGLRERFMAEIRLLATLEHPNIARLIDGGLDLEQRPYLVMEYVQGVPITEFADRNALDIAGKVALIHQVSDAVSHAHQQLIVHCDLKPSNVLINEQGQAKLVDFGIAGLIKASAQMQPDAFRQGVLCSPGYCAPEQLRGEPPAPAQDVHGLGALMFELLSGQRLRDTITVTQLLFNPRRALPPPRSPGQLNARIDSDLNAICIKALAEQPEERFRTADAFNQDLHNWADDRPVQARNGGRAYLWGKWLKRNWLPTASIGAVIVALSLGTIIATQQTREAVAAQARSERELARASAMNDFVLGLFEGARSGSGTDRLPSTRELLVRGAETAKIRFDDQALPRGDMLTVIGKIMLNAGLHQDALSTLEIALEARETSLGAQSELTAEARMLLGMTYHYNDRIDRAIEELEVTVETLKSIGPPAMLAKAMQALAHALSEQPASERMLEMHRSAIAIQRTLSDTNALAMGLASFGRSLQRAGQFEDSATAYEEAIVLHRESTRLDRYALSTALSDYAVTLRRLGRLDEAESVLREALRISDGIYSGPHVVLSQRWNTLGTVLTELDRRTEAIDAFQKALSISTAVHSTSHITIAGPLNNLGFLNLGTGQYSVAEDYLNRAMAILETNVGRDHPFHIAVSHNLGKVLMAQSQFEPARDLLSDTLDRALIFHAGDVQRLEAIRASMGQVLLLGFDDPRGLEMIKAAYRAVQEEIGPDQLTTAKHAQTLGEAFLFSSAPDQAVDMFAQALRITEAELAPRHHRVFKARAGLAEAFLALNQNTAAREALQAIGELPPEGLIPSDPLRSQLIELQRRLQTAATASQ